MLTHTWHGVANYLGAVWDYRYFWSCLVQAELRRRYRRSLLGMGWSMLQPMMMTVVLALVYRRLFNISFWNFAPMLLTGLAFWNMFTQIVLQGCQSLVVAEPYLRQQPLPLAIFPLRTTLTIGFHFVISLAVALGFVVCFKGMPPILPLLTVLPTLGLLFLFAWAVAVLASFLHVYFPDTQHIAEVGLQMLMFLTPIMYPPDLLRQNGMGFLLQVNPLALLLDLLRAPIINGEYPALGNVGIALLCVGVVGSLAIWTVARLEERLIFAL